MKLVDILLVLSAATANAILIPIDNDRPTQASVTSSQVSGPTNEPNSGTSDQDWKSIVDAINSSIFSQDWQDPIDLIRVLPNKVENDQLINWVQAFSEQDWKVIIDKPDPGIPEDWQDLIDAINSNITSQDQQQPIDESSSSTSKRGRKRPIDQPIPSTSSQHQQQPMSEGKSINTVPNRIILLNQRCQRIFDEPRQRLVASKVIRNKKRKEYREYTKFGLKQRSALSSKETSESKYSPKTEIQLKQEYKKLKKRVYNLRDQLKAFMKRRGLEFQEPN
ncbi:hypothetical protein BDEG_28069 [Batrachochytrium dendrobatidis JEL423]|uniref:BZIP domain-containing protein n=1 Tax=Batrachochytrium dendrobatidis (strain JEL423) TaxID=403673 RepID=A0A177WZ17_BATDL|nr:hypothetical protein BDEG_28069 [Batrachochytrium dendrobatidis JEL423]